ncbi:MAG: hypothetical protein K0R99_439 [Microbacterium sp.]|jgi:hypothetical protein|nr:hypothetical protein [Microbacterium sp.]
MRRSDHYCLRRDGDNLVERDVRLLPASGRDQDVSHQKAAGGFRHPERSRAGVWIGCGHDVLTLKRNASKTLFTAPLSEGTFPAPAHAGRVERLHALRDRVAHAEPVLDVSFRIRLRDSPAWWTASTHSSRVGCRERLGFTMCGESVGRKLPQFTTAGHWPTARQMLVLDGLHELNCVQRHRWRRERPSRTEVLWSR